MPLTNCFTHACAVRQERCKWLTRLNRRFSPDETRHSLPTTAKFLSQFFEFRHVQFPVGILIHPVKLNLNGSKLGFER